MHVSIRIKGHLDQGWQERLQKSDDTSRLFGSLQDQLVLHEVLSRIGHLSLPLLLLEASEPKHDEE